MRQPTYVPDKDQLLKDFHGTGSSQLDDVAPDAVSITVEEYLNPRDVHHRRPSPSDDDLLSTTVRGSPWEGSIIRPVALLGRDSSVFSGSD